MDRSRAGGLSGGLLEARARCPDPWLKKRREPANANSSIHEERVTPSSLPPVNRGRWSQLRGCRAERARRDRDPVAIDLRAACGLIHELLARTLASYVLGDSVTQFSLIIGIYLPAIGAGAWLSLLEEAFHHGLRAAEEVLQARGVPFNSLL